MLKKFESSRLFTDREAWFLFRLAAFGEAVGWTLLLIGLGLKQFVVHGSDVPVKITGQFHGTLFLLYLVASIILYPSLGWRRRWAVLAVAVSVPPYGSLVFEQVAAYLRHRKQLKIMYQQHAYFALAGIPA